MHLQRKIFLSVEQFCQDRKTCGIRDIAKNLLTMFTPKGMEGETAKATIVDDTLRLGTIHHFP